MFYKNKQKLESLVLRSKFIEKLQMMSFLRDDFDPYSTHQSPYSMTLFHIVHTSLPDSMT